MRALLPAHTALAVVQILGLGLSCGYHVGIIEKAALGGFVVML